MKKSAIAVAIMVILAGGIAPLAVDVYDPDPCAGLTGGDCDEPQ